MVPGGPGEVAGARALARPARPRGPRGEELALLLGHSTAAARAAAAHRAAAGRVRRGRGRGYRGRVGPSRAHAVAVVGGGRALPRGREVGDGHGGGGRRGGGGGRGALGDVQGAGVRQRPGGEEQVAVVLQRVSPICYIVDH